MNDEKCGDLKMTQKDITKHIPDLWKYSQLLCSNDNEANNLLENTIHKAMQKSWKKPKETPTYTWLSRMMYGLFLDINNAQRSLKDRDNKRHFGTLRTYFRMPILPDSMRSQHPISIH